MFCGLKVAAVAALVASSPGNVLAQAIVPELGVGIAGTGIRGPVRGIVAPQAPGALGRGPAALALPRTPAPAGRGRFGAGTGGILPGTGSAVGGITGPARAGSGGVQDTLTLGSGTGGVRGSGTNAGTGGVVDLGSLGRNTGGIDGSPLGAGSGGIDDLGSLGSGTGGLIE